MILIPVKRLIMAALVVALASNVAACTTEQPTDGLSIVATTTVFGDIARNIVTDHAVVDTLMPAGVDPHDFRPSPGQVAAISDADLVIANGGGLEEGLDDVLTAAERDGVRIIRIADIVAGPDADPHVWLDPGLMQEAAVAIAGALNDVDSSIDWNAQATAYARMLDDVIDQMNAILAAIPADERRLVTNHDSLEYFARAFGFEILGTVIPTSTTLAEPSAADLAALIAVIEGSGVKAIFADDAAPTLIAEAVAAELGTDIAVVTLFTGSLGEPGSVAGTYADMMIENARRIAAALG